MTDLIVWIAQYLLWVAAAGYGVIWWLAERRCGKVTLGLAAVIGVIVVLILVAVAGAVHTDPRPFVQDPSIRPLFPHAPDNGFPSDHSAAAGMVAVLIGFRHRWYGAILGVAALLIAWTRVAAHVHHVQDVVAGLLLGGVAAVLAYLAAGAITSWLARRPDTLPGRLARIPPRDTASADAR